MLLGIVASVIFGVIAANVASAKQRASGEGFLLGFMLGPIGLLIEALLSGRVGIDGHEESRR